MLNFIKSNIFSSCADKYSEYPVSVKGVQMLAVWGSPGCGKTTVAVKLAKYLADRHQNVVLLLCDSSTPALPCLCSSSDLECEKSLGSILAATHVTDTLIKQNCITHKKIRNLALIGMLKGENAFTYPTYSPELAKELFDHLRNIAPYIIIDCGSMIAYDVLSAVGLLEADSVLRLANCDLKSISYLSSQLPLLKDKKWDADKQYRVTSNVKTNQASEQIEQVLGRMAFRIPHSIELENQALSGGLFKDLCFKDSRAFRQEIQRISKEVFGI